MPEKNLYGNNIPTSDIILQSFKKNAKVDRQRGSWYKLLKAKVSDLHESKISLVWLPPPCKSKDQDYVGYTPMDYYDLGEYKQWIQYWDSNEGRTKWYHHEGKETLYGTNIDLLELIQEYKSKNIKCIADIVINHREGQQVNAQGEWICWKSDEHQIASGKMAWGYKDNDPPEIVYNSGGGSRDDGEGGYAANLAHENPKVRTEINEWLDWMKNNIGFSGWRYDMVKGFAPQHLGEYNYNSQPFISIGEFHDGDAQKIYDWIDQTDGYDTNKKSMAFDFPLKWFLNKIFWGSEPFQNLRNWQNPLTSITSGWPAKSVTFLENHDTVETPYQDFPKDNKRLVQAYVFLLTHPGIPCIYWSHFYEKNQHVHNKIKQLCQFRRNQNITNLSQVSVVCSDNSCYSAMVDDKIIVKIGDAFWSPYGIYGNWKLELFGRGWAIWVKE